MKKYSFKFFDTTASALLCAALLCVHVGTAEAAVAFRSAASAAGGTNANITINKPSGAIQNDVLIASIAFRPETLTVTPPPGWSLVRRQENANTQGNAVGVYMKVLTGSEPANYTWNFSGGSTGSAGGIAAFTGVDTSNPIDTSAGATTGATQTLSINAPSISAALSNEMLVTAHANANANTWAPPSGMTEAFDTSSVSPTNDIGQSVEMNYLLLSGGGSTGTKTANVEGGPTPDVGEGIALALTPDGVIDPPTFTSSGSWTAPPGVTQVLVEAWGGGGAGGAATGNPAAGGGGAGGAYARKVVSVTPGNTYTVTVGSGGTGDGNSGDTGNPSWFSTSGTIYAQGGAGGALASTNGSNAAGGAGSAASSIGDQVYRGGNGSTGDNQNGNGHAGGAGGGGAGSSGQGGDASGGNGGTGTNLGGGNGADGVNSNSAGASGSAYGGGGSGGKARTNTNRNGGSGSGGAVAIHYPPIFSMQYYSDSGLTTPITDNAYLKANTYYVKINSSKTLDSAPTVSINAEGIANDITNALTTLVSGTDYKYTRVITSDAAAVGNVLEDWSVTGTSSALVYSNQNPTNESTKAAYTDTVAPVISGTTPITNASIASITSSSAVNFILSEAIASGDITMTRTGGTADPSSPHTCTFVGAALNTGAHNAFDMSNTTNSCSVSQSLVNGAIYTFVWNATDTAGNVATPVTATNVNFTTVGPLDHFAVTDTSGNPIGNQTKGVPFNIKIVAQDASNNTVTSFTSTVALSNLLSGISPSTSGSFTTGVLSSQSVTLSTVGTDSITATASGKTGTSNTFTVNNPTPTTTSIAPNTISAGGPAFTMIVYGTNFVSGASVLFNGNTRATTFISSTELHVSILAGDITTAGSFLVKVHNPTPVAADSNSQVFTVHNLIPQTTSVSPGSVPAGSPQTTITVTGSNFLSDSVVYFGATALTTMYIGGTQLTAIIPPALLASLGTYSITVFTPSTGETSNPQAFTVGALGRGEFNYSRTFYGSASLRKY